MCYVYSSLVSALRGFWGLAASAPAKSELDICESFFKVPVKDDAHGLGWETQTQLTP